MLQPSLPPLAMLGLLLLAGAGWGADVLDFRNPPLEVVEGVGAVAVAVSRSGSGVGAVTVDYATSNISATAGSDYTIASGTLSWAAGDLADKYLSVTILDDAVFEVSQSFRLTLSAPTGGATVPTSTADLVIVDDDANPAGILTMEIADPAATRSVTEGVGSTAVVVTRSGGTTGAVGVSVFVNGIEAVAGTDYTVPATPTLSWADGESGGKTLLVPILDDALPELAKSFSLGLISLTGGVSLGQSNGMTVVIIDDDSPLAGILSLPSTVVVNENDGTATVTVARLGGSSGAVSIDYSTAFYFSSAVAGSDFTDVAGTLSWAAGDLTARTISIPLIDDGSAELTEEAYLVFQNPVGGLLLPSEYPYSELSILDDDPTAGVLGFASTDVSIAEGDGSLVLSVTRTGGTSGAITIDYATADGYALDPDDYSATTGTLNWAAGDAAPKTISVTLVDDAIFEWQESFSVSLSNPTGAAQLESYLADADIHLDDDDLPSAGTLTLTPTVSTVAEGAGSVTFTITRTGGSTGPISTIYGLGGGTATNPGDYSGALRGTLSWADGDATSRTVVVPIVDDAVAEGPEPIRIGISVPSNGATVTGAYSATCTIVDDDAVTAGTLRFTAASTTVSEGAGTAVITVARSGGSTGAVTVTCATAFNGTALPGTNALPAFATLSWAAGDAASKSFSIPLIDNALPGPTTTLQVRLADPTGGAVLDTADGLPEVDCLILDNDVNPAGTLGFSASTATVSEAAGTITLSVARSGGSAGLVSVRYALTGGLALDGADVTAVSGVLTWNSGEAAAKTILVPILDDALIEDDEPFTVWLSLPAGGADLGTDYQTITITDDEANPVGRLALTAATTIAAESATTVTVYVARSGGTTGAVTVRYTLTDVSATGGVDYSGAGSGVLSWATGDGSDKTVALTLANDLLGEGRETLQVVLDTPTGGASLGTSTATIAIDDPAAAVAAGDSSGGCGSGGLAALVVLLGMLGSTGLVRLRRPG